jgi:chromosome segregation ATPase
MSNRAEAEVVAEWRAAMENLIARLNEDAVRLPKALRVPEGVILDEAAHAAQAASAISGLLALIESQSATIERVERERDSCADKAVEQTLKLDAAEARVTALEAEKAELRAAFKLLISDCTYHLEKYRPGPLSAARKALAQPSTQENDNGR